MPLSLMTTWCNGRGTSAELTLCSELSALKVLRWRPLSIWVSSILGSILLVKLLFFLYFPPSRHHPILAATPTLIDSSLPLACYSNPTTHSHVPNFSSFPLKKKTTTQDGYLIDTVNNKEFSAWFLAFEKDFIASFKSSTPWRSSTLSYEVADGTRGPVGLWI